VIWFLDTSAFVKRYVVEPGRAAVLALHRGRRVLAAARVTEVEIASSLARAARRGLITSTVASDLCDRAAEDLRTYQVVELRPAVVAVARDLALRRGLRGYDAVQLGSALFLTSRVSKALRFVTADGDLADAARDEGLGVLVV
jgi:predicted nucleic acid-binding protein